MNAIHAEFANLVDSAMRACGFTNESLAEVVGCSRNSISAYRSGESLPSDDIVLQLIAALNEPMLGWAWLRSNKVGATFLPAVPKRQLAQSILDLRVGMRHAVAVQDEIDEIGRDGHVEAHEYPVWIHCTKKLEDVVRSVFSLLLAHVHKEKKPLNAA